MSQGPDLNERLLAAGDSTGTQADFARFVGWDKSHITRLKQAGQLVMAEDGKSVNFAASLRRILDQADPARDAQRAEAAGRRPPAAAPAPESTQQAALPPGNEDDGALPAGDSASLSYATSRARKEHWQSELARLEYERAVGQVVPRREVELAMADAAMVFRQALENMPHRVAPDLVGKDLDAVRAMLKGEAQSILAELSRAFAQRLAQLAGADQADDAAEAEGVRA